MSIIRAADKLTQLSLAQYAPEAREGELIVDISDPTSPALFLGTTDGSAVFVGGAGVTGQPDGPLDSLQFRKDAQNFDGSAALVFDPLANVLTVGGNIAAGNIDATGNITAGNLSVTGNISGNIDIQDNANIGGDLTINGNLQVYGNATYVNVNNLSVTDPIISMGGANGGGNATGYDGADRGLFMYNYYANGSGPVNQSWVWNTPDYEFKAIAAGVLNANNTVAVVEYGNIRANVLIGNIDGSPISDFVPYNNELYSLGNANLRFSDIWQSGGNVHIGGATLNGNGGTFNVSSNNITMTGNTTLSGNMIFSGPVDLGDVANVSIGGGNSGQILQTYGNGQLNWANAANESPYIRFVVGSNGANQLFSSPSIASFNDANSINVTKDGVYLEPTIDFVLANATTIQINTWLTSTSTIDVMAASRGAGTLAPIPVYGVFWSNVSQSLTSPNTATIVTLNNSVNNTLCALSSGTRVVIQQVGTYNIQVTLQVYQPNTTQKTSYFWLARNGVNIPNTTIRFNPTVETEASQAMNWIISTTSIIDYIEVKWGSATSSTTLSAYSSDTWRPAVPSVKVTVSSVVQGIA
jgi:hypothetical protein